MTAAKSKRRRRAKTTSRSGRKAASEAGLPPQRQSHGDTFEALLRPTRLAVVGASSAAGSVGGRVFSNLLGGPPDLRVYPVNPNRRSVLRRRAYADLASVPEPVDLALVATPAASVPGIIEQCVEAGVRAALILSAGFREIGPPGVELEQQILQAAEGSGLRIVGPNSLGLMNPARGLNASFAPALPAEGSVAFLSQSGALGSAILDWSQGERVGFSAFVSVGSMLDVGWGDLIREFGDDPNTKSIVIYMESLGNARSFLSAAREVALRKPIIVLKAGSTEAASRAVAAHTGGEVCSDEVFDAALRRVGVLRVRSVSSLFYMADILSKQPPPRGPRLTILTNAGGPGVLASDALSLGGGQLAPLSDEAFDALDELLPVAWSHANPIDLLGDASAERYAAAAAVAGRDPNSDGLLVILAPQAMTDATGTAEALAALKPSCAKPILASWMGGEHVAEGAAALARSGIPSFPYPDTASRVFTYMWRYAYNLRGLYETPSLDPAVGDVEWNRARVDQLLWAAHEDGTVELADAMMREIFAEYGIGVAESRSRITRTGPPLRISSRSDAQFGPVLALEAGGSFRELHAGRALGLPPLNTTLARRLLEQTRIHDPACDGAGRAGLELLLVRVSHLVAEQPWIRRVELDPLHLTRRGWLAFAARIRLHPSEMQAAALPELAIRPYPAEWVRSWTTKSGRSVVLRPIRPEDEPLMVEFHRTLSNETVYSRYLGALGLERRIEHERLTQLCFIDYDREIALVVDSRDPETGEHQIGGVARLVRLHRSADAEYAIVISDAMQGEGLGSQLLRRLIEVAETEHIDRIVGEVLPDNRRMLRACSRLGFRQHRRGSEPTFVELKLGR